MTLPNRIPGGGTGIHPSSTPGIEPVLDLRRRVAQYQWFHSIDLGHGVVTPGVKSQELLAAEARAIFGPCNLEGKSVLDVCAWNGYFAFEAKRRGAARVLATDDYCWSHPQYRGKETFDLACDALQVDVEDLQIDVSHLSLERVGSFDIVLFLGVFYHLIDPIRVLQSIAPIATERLVLETHLDLHDLGRPGMVFYPGAELANDESTWWGPNRQAIECLLRQFGFDVIDFRPHPVVGAARGIFHARRSNMRPQAGRPRSPGTVAPFAHTAPLPASNDVNIQFTDHEVEGLGRISFATDGAEWDGLLHDLRAGYTIEPEVRYCLEVLEPGQQFTDVGAHLGEFTLPIGKRGVRCLAIEALPKNFTLLAKAIQRTGLRHVVPVHAAATNATGVGAMSGHGAWGSLAESGIPVPRMTLDDLTEIYGFEQPKIVRIDVEGGERAVLRGMRRLLTLPDLEIIIECNSWACRSNNYSGGALLAQLARLGFNLYLFEGDVLVPRQPEDFQEACSARYLAIRRLLPTGPLGSFFVRTLTLEESLETVERQLEQGSAQRWHVANALQYASKALLDDPKTTHIFARLEADADLLVREALAWRGSVG